MRRDMDLWQCAVVDRPIELLNQEELDVCNLVWLPSPASYAFRADPFGLWRNGHLCVFVESMDYRVRIGHIDVLEYDSSLQLCSAKTVLAEPWHLSYPFVFEAEGETWMLPEAYRSGTLTLYRALRFPDQWEPVCSIPLDGPAIDASVIRFEDRWWMFYSPYGNQQRRRSHLHLAWADQLVGPWHLHPLNPVRVDSASGRPGGTPFVRDGKIELPVQDCRVTYGGAIRRLRVSALDKKYFEATDSPWLHAPSRANPYVEGLHTVSAAGPLSLIDVKRTDNSWRANAVRIRGVVSRHLRERSHR